MSSEAITRNDLKNVLNEVLPSEPVEADYVVEQGVSGMWTYRKWSSGIAECWGGLATTLSHYATALGGYGYYTVATFPSDFFISAPIVQYSAYIGDSFALTGTLTTAWTKDSINLYAISNISGLRNTSWYVRAIGRWK